ncbi:XrtA/PEP-CTERM system histidine kinase PrsK [Alteromonas lipolytica]|uniref:histidine kinase n=1 Tax=Alteromonas lipolytica TaxID=1856405 RepID=A0A1E8FA49_9ALTE|nr:XrtA/PEP-CTERM system histidine kinase PrsK [Alteromonas lipolytica]OFI32656.1 ATPase [Alteromonas lipolytica]GGF74338.1 histidine kinase [Alteromonas lipolytica]
MIADIGYGLNSMGYLMLLLLLFTVRKPGLAKYMLSLATLVTLLWSLSFVSYLSGPLSVFHLLQADTIKQGVWLLFIASCLKNDFANLWQVLRQPATVFALIVPAIALVTPWFIHVDITWHFLLQTLIALEGLILLEVLYRQVGKDQWAYKPLALYLGATNLFEFVSYANATMVANIEPGFIAARGYFYLLMLPFLVIATRRIKHWGVSIFISRDVVLHSSLLLVAGVYLFIMAAMGYVISYLGWSWGSTVQIILVALSLVVLATVFMSNNFRTRIKVFITKHFFANQFDYRAEWVKLTNILSSNDQSLPSVYNVALEGVMGAINYDSGALVKKQGPGFHVVSSDHFGSLDEVEATLKPLWEYCERTGWLIDLDEYRTKPYVYEGLNLPNALIADTTLQLIIPFIRHDNMWGLALLCAVDRPKVALNWEVRDYLNAVTNQIANFIYLHEAAQSLAENAQFAAFNRMAAFVLHDLKNVLAQIDLILCNAEQHKANPEFIEDTFETLHHTKARMDRMLRQLTEKQVEEKGANATHTLSALIEQVIEKRCQSLLPIPQMVVKDETSVVVDQDKFANVMYHLLSNAQQACADDGEIEVTLVLDAQHGHQLVFIEDNGTGMDEEFIKHRLFKPFDTTKGNAGMGIGAYDAKTYMESIGGYLQVQSQPGVGTCFTLGFPVE